eukprot:360384-Chlamydomonas_euryale.AAC.3
MSAGSDFTPHMPERGMMSGITSIAAFHAAGQRGRRVVMPQGEWSYSVTASICTERVPDQHALCGQPMPSTPSCRPHRSELKRVFQSFDLHATSKNVPVHSIFASCVVALMLPWGASSLLATAC